MSEQDTQHPGQRAAAFSWKLFAFVMLLSILPPLLPFLFSRLADVWIFPRAAAALQQCADFVCQEATDWIRLEWLLILGPSLFVALVSVLVGIIGYLRLRRHLTSPENRPLFWMSVCCGGVWFVLLGCILGVMYYLASIHD